MTYTQSEDNPFTGFKRTFIIAPKKLLELGLCEYQFCIIDLIKRKTRRQKFCKCKNKHLAEFLGISKSQITYYMLRLIAGGWVQRSKEGYYFDDWESTDRLFSYDSDYRFYILYLDVLIELDITLYQFSILYEIFYVKHVRKQKKCPKISIQKMCEEMGFSRNGFKDVVNGFVAKGIATWVRGTSEIQLNDSVLKKIEEAQIQNSTTKNLKTAKMKI